MMNGFLVIQTRVFASVVLVPLQRAKLLQSCPVLCDPVNQSLPGSSLHGILQARKLEWLPGPSPGDLPDPGVEPVFSPTLAGGLSFFCLFLPLESSGKPALGVSHEKVQFILGM